MAVPEIRTERLVLRPWRDDDLGPFAAMNADPRVMAYFPEVLSYEKSAEIMVAIRMAFAARGFGVWAVGLAKAAPSAWPSPLPFVGMLGLTVPRFEAHFTPCVEVLWRLSADHWGRGYATEGARAAMTFGFETLRLPEIVAFTTTHNQRSRRVMEKLGMSRAPSDDFDHPSLPEDHPLRPHVLYRLRAGDHGRGGVQEGA